MPAPLKVPTIFTAVDRVTGVVQRMQRSVGGFAGKASIGINALNNGINRLIPSFGRLAKQAIGIGAGYAIFQGLSAGGSAIIDFEKNVASLRVTLNHLSDSQFKPYEQQIIAVARATKMSAVDVADSFAKIAELNYDLAGTPDGLAKLATSAITLARAARIELTPATEGLVAIMSQFDLPASQAERLSNALAAGFKYGSASIEDQIESYRGFGTVAKEANVTMEQSIALTQTLAKYQLKGAEAGTALRSAIIHLQNAGAGYKSGKFSLNDALDEMRKKLASLKNDKSRDSFLNSLFGIRAVTQGRLLGRSADLMNDLSRNVTGTNEAFKQAAITTETFASKWEQLKGSIATYLVSNDSANAGLERLKGIIVYVTNNLDKIIDRIITFGKIFLWLKGIIYAVQAVLFLMNVRMGILAATTGICNIAIGESSVALAAYRTAMLLTGGSASALSGSMAGVAGGFTAATTAASGFFATLSAFAMPAALLAAIAGLAALAVYDNGGVRGKTLKQSKIDEFAASRDSQLDSLTKSYSNGLAKTDSLNGVPKSLSRIMERGDLAKSYRDSLSRANPLFGNKEVMDIAASTPMARDNTGTITININDPRGLVASVDSSGNVKPKFKLNPGVTVTPTKTKRIE